MFFTFYTQGSIIAGKTMGFYQTSEVIYGFLCPSFFLNILSQKHQTFTRITCWCVKADYKSVCASYDSPGMALGNQPGHR